MNQLEEKLLSLRDEKFYHFQIKLFANKDELNMIGIKTPVLKNIAKELYISGEYKDFLEELPHKYFEADQIHAFILPYIKDYDLVITYLKKFLPYVNNWATCDQISLPILKSHLDKTMGLIDELLNSNETYKIRYGIRLLMNFYLEDKMNTKEILNKVVNVKSDEYYVKMMQAWFFQVALVKQYDEAIIIIENKVLDPFVQNKTISKCHDSYQISKEKKEYLKKIKVR